ncbi:hypothetical protein ES703_95910 [subsurface metagenome]
MRPVTALQVIATPESLFPLAPNSELLMIMPEEPPQEKTPPFRKTLPTTYGAHVIDMTHPILWYISKSGLAFSVAVPTMPNCSPHLVLSAVNA